MAAEGAPSPQGRSLRCDDCGRPVRETEHTQTDYRVDYYSLYTGEVEPQSAVSDDGLHHLTFQRLLNAAEIVTCADCYGDPSVRRRREERFRQEDAPGGQENARE
jgi:hypothetical protein